jgi:hypothetical protein
MPTSLSLGTVVSDFFRWGAVWGGAEADLEVEITSARAFPLQLDRVGRCRHMPSVCPPGTPNPEPPPPSAAGGSPDMTCNLPDDSSHPLVAQHLAGAGGGTHESWWVRVAR